MLKFKLRRSVVFAYGDPNSLKKLRDYLAVKTANSFFRRTRYWDGRIRFFNQRNACFSYGLWPSVKWWCKKKGFKYEVISDIKRDLGLRIKRKSIKGIKLSKEQVGGVNAWFEKGGFGIIWAPAGSGKTEIAAAVIKKLDDYIDKTLFIVNSQDLLLQARGRFRKRLGVKVGVIGAGRLKTNADLAVATIQTLSRLLKKPQFKRPRKKISKKQLRKLQKKFAKTLKKWQKRHDKLKAFLDRTNLIVYDECHHGRSQETKTVIANSPAAKFRLGVSASPFHEYSKNLQKMTASDVTVLACMGPVVHRTQKKTLVDKGWLAEPRLYLIPLFINVHSEASWHTTRTAVMMSNQLKHTICQMTKTAAEAGEMTLVIAGNSIDFGNRIAQQLMDDGVKVYNLHGSIDKDTREKVRKLATKGKVEAIVATTIYDEGVDIPNLRQLILPPLGKSMIKLEQRIGRALRRKDGSQNVAIINDFMAMGNKHLRRHSIHRLKQYIKDPAFKIRLVNPDEHNAYIVRLLKKRNHKNVSSTPSVRYFQKLKEAA